MPSLLSLLLSLLLSIAPRSVTMEPPRPVKLPTETAAAVAAIETRLPAMQKVEAQEDTLPPYTLWYDSGKIRKVFNEEFEETTYYDERETLLYGRRNLRDGLEEAVFAQGKLVGAFRNGLPAPGDEASWAQTIDDARPAVANEMAFVKKPMSAIGANWDELGNARKKLDAEAAAIDAARGDTVEKSVWGLSTEGGRLLGFSIDGILRRVSLDVYGETFRNEETYYLRDGAPFLVVHENYDYTMPMTERHSRTGGYDHERYYFFADRGGMNTSESVDATLLNRYIDLLNRPETEFGAGDLSLPKNK